MRARTARSKMRRHPNRPNPQVPLVELEVVLALEKKLVIRWAQKEEAKEYLPVFLRQGGYARSDLVGRLRVLVGRGVIRCSVVISSARRRHLREYPEGELFRWCHGIGQV